MVNCLEISPVIQAMMLKYGSIQCHSVFCGTLVCKGHLTMFLPFGYKLMIIFSTLKTDCSELRVGWYRETSLSPPVIFLLTVPRRYFFHGYFFYLYLSLPYCLVCVLQYYGHLLGKGCFPGSPVCGVLLCFCHFPLWCTGT